MSRVGKRPVTVPSGVTANVEGQTVKVKGPKGQLQLVVHDDVSVTLDKGAVKVAPRFETKRSRSLYGTSRAQIANLVEGVTKGFEKKLEINGVGYRAAVQGKNLQLALGYSHDVMYRDPGRHHDRDAEADRDRHHRHRRPACRPGRRRNPRLASAGALQGQGREVRRRIHLPQGRQEEVTERHVEAENHHARRKNRVRIQIKRAANGRPRLSVFRSSKHIYAQIIDDVKGADPGCGLVDGKEQRAAPRPAPTSRRRRRSASWSPSARSRSGIKDVVFDRGKYLYHGRIKALADAARESGLNF